jgi:Fic family protein
MDVDKFSKSPSGRIVQSGQGETAYWSFIPNPLPPELAFEPELIRALSDADRSLGELAGLGRTMPNPHLLIRPFILREAVLSSRIEGTQADIADLYAYEARQLPLPGVKSPVPESDVKEVHNYVVALEYGLKRLKTLPVSLRLIRELHERLMKGVRGGHATPGEFRRTQNWIGPAGCSLRDATYVPPPAPNMQEALDRLEKFIHSDNELPPLIRIGLIHYQFEAIHPFIDGNGRIGRLLITILLAHWNLLPLPLLYLSAYFESRRKEYYEHLLNVSSRGAWREWLIYYLRGVSEQGRDAIERAKKLQDLQQEWRGRLQASRRTSVLLLQLADELFQTPILTVPNIQKTLKVTHRAADQMVKRLIELKILKPIPGQARNRQFEAKAILNIVGKSS